MVPNPINPTFIILVSSGFMYLDGSQGNSSFVAWCLFIPLRKEDLVKKHTLNISTTAKSDSCELLSG